MYFYNFIQLCFKIFYSTHIIYFFWNIANLRYFKYKKVQFQLFPRVCIIPQEEYQPQKSQLVSKSLSNSFEYNDVVWKKWMCF